MKAPSYPRAPLLALALLAAPAAAPAQVTLTADAGAFNAYIWRGVTLTNRFVVQPDLYLTVPAGNGSVVVGAWGNIEAGQYDSPTHMSQGGGLASFDATEVDFWAEYGAPLGTSGLTGTFGGVLYTFPNPAGATATNDASRTVELYGKLQLADAPLAPKLALWYDVDKVKGTYLEGSVAHTVGGVPGFPITLGALAGFSAGQGINADDPTQVANFAENGLTHVDLSATGALTAGPVTIAPTVHFLILNDEFTQVTRPGRTRDMKAWAGVTLTWSKALTKVLPSAE